MCDDNRIFNIWCLQSVQSCLSIKQNVCQFDSTWFCCQLLKRQINQTVILLNHNIPLKVWLWRYNSIPKSLSTPSRGFGWLRLGWFRKSNMASFNKTIGSHRLYSEAHAHLLFLITCTRMRTWVLIPYLEITKFSNRSCVYVVRKIGSAISSRNKPSCFPREE